MFKLVRFSAAALLLLWLGVTLTLTFYVAPSLFSNESGVVANSGIAGEIISPLLNKMYLTGRIVLPVLLVLHGILWAWSGANRRRAVVVSGLLLIAAFGVDLYAGIPLNNKVHSIRVELKKEFGSFDLAPKDHPERKRFGMLHGVSMVLVLVNMGLGLGSFFCVTQLIPDAGAEKVRRDATSAASARPSAV